MNKADLVTMVSARTMRTKGDVTVVVDAITEAIIDSLAEGKKVSFLGFGSFEPRDRTARKGLNPKTGEIIKIPAKRVPVFKAGKLFKDRVQCWWLFGLEPGLLAYLNCSVVHASCRMSINSRVMSLN